MMPLRSSPLRRKLRRAELKRFFVPLVELLEDRRLLALGHDALSLMTGDLHESLAPSPIITQYHLLNAAGYLTDPAEGAPLEIALDYLRSNASDFGLTTADFDQVNIDRLVQGAASDRVGKRRGALQDHSETMRLIAKQAQLAGSVSLADQHQVPADRVGPVVHELGRSQDRPVAGAHPLVLR